MYLKAAREQLKNFRWFKIEQVPRTENVEADSLARQAFGLEDGTFSQTPIEFLIKPSTNESADHVMPVEYSPRWVNLILEYMTKGKIPEDKNEGRRLKYQANKYTVMNEKLYQRGYAMPYLRCLRPDEADYVLKEIHDRVYSNHFGKRSLVQKALRQVYY